MEKIIFEDLPSTNTPINATNLNTVQDNVERALENTGGAGNLKIALGLDQDTYDSTATYSVGDLVIHDNIIYECNTDIDTAEEWDETKWDVVPIIDKTTNPAFNLSPPKDIITVNLANNMSITETADTPLVDMTVHSQIGNNLTLNNGKVKIGAGITHVIVSAFESVTPSSTAGVRNINIFKNGAGLKSAKYYSSGTSTGIVLVLPDLLIPVQENDEINIVSYVRSGDRIDGGNYYTYFTVEAVNYE